MIGHEHIVTQDDVRCQCGHVLIPADQLPNEITWTFGDHSPHSFPAIAEAAHAAHIAELEARRLYGLRRDEYLQTDPAVVYERWLDDRYEAPGPDETPLEIIEWSCVDLNTQITAADYILERIAEDIGDECGYGEAGEAASKACHHPDVVEACEAMRAEIAAKFTGWLTADSELRTLIVTWDADGEPLLDGEPMYRKVNP
jgi:hypothetical protein